MKTLSDLETRTSTSAAFLPLLTWSSCSNPPQTTTQGPYCSINRYYDPTTYSFISVDPYFLATDQAYVFADDNPLNATDPLGLKCGVIQCGGKIISVTLKPVTSGSTSLSGQQNVEVYVGTGTISVSNTFTVKGANSSSVYVDINLSTGEVTVSGGNDSVSFTPSTISAVTPVSTWGSISTGAVSATLTKTIKIDGVNVTDSTAAAYTPDPWSAFPAAGIFAGIINPVRAIGVAVLKAIDGGGSEPLPVAGMRGPR